MSPIATNGQRTTDNRIHRIGRLPVADLRLLAVVLALQVALAGALRLTRVSRLRTFVGRCRPMAQLLAGAREERVVWSIEAVGRRLPGVSTCLVRALTADVLLTGQLRVGVRCVANGGLQSHAWFERDGQILVGAAGAAEFVPFITL